MKKTGIVTDSHSSISQELGKELGILIIPMPFFIEEECFLEGVSITRDEFMEKLESGCSVSTSQPSPADVMQIWDRALEEYEEILYMPLSSGLSGSYMTAFALAQEEPYEGKVYVVDHGRTATPLHRSILDALELIEEGYSAGRIREILERARDEVAVYIAVDTLKYLKKGGRVTPAAAAVGSVLRIKPILSLSVGKLDSFMKARGMAAAKKLMIESLQKDLNTRFKKWYDKGEVTIMAASTATEAETKRWCEEIEEAFPGYKVMCDYLSLGVCCHTGGGALGIGCSCRPERD